MSTDDFASLVIIILVGLSMVVTGIIAVAITITTKNDKGSKPKGKSW
jgi:hypothetical protein